MIAINNFVLLYVELIHTENHIIMNIFRRNLLLVGLAVSGVFVLQSCSKDFSPDTVIPKEVTSTVYIGDNSNFVYALDPDNGEKKWELNTGGPVLANVVIYDNAAWIGSTSGMLYKVDRATGAIINSRNMGSAISVTPLKFKDNLYVAAGNTLHMIDKNTLQSLFTGAAGGSITGAPTGHSILGFEHDHVFVSAGNTVRSFRYDSLFVNTTFTCPDPGSFEMSPCIENDTVMYIGNTNGNVYAVNTRTNAVRWSYTTGGAIYSTLLTVGGNILFGSHDSRFYSIDTETGMLRWNIKTGDRISSAPYVHNQDVYFGGYDKHVYCIDIIDGVVKWKVPTVGLIKGSPVVAKDKVYIAGYDQIMICLDAETGEQHWNKNIGGMVDGAPMVDNISSIYVPAIDGSNPLK